MFIKKLYLKNYRNYQTTEISFDNCVNVIIGENAQGKTNIIESIYLLALAKSHRTPRDKELIYWEEDFAKIEGDIQKRHGSVQLELVISNKGKKVKVNGIEQRKLSEFVGNANIVMFAPEDLNIVKGSPQIRRRFIDMEIGQITPMYIHHLAVYQKILLQRNHLLKELQRRQGNKLMLEVLTSQLIETAVKILQKRYEYIIQLEEWAKHIHFQISREKERLNIKYKPSIEVSDSGNLSKLEEEYSGRFKELTEKEIQRGTTLIGPHRDDLLFSINDKDVQTFGSQGQQRTTALSVKMAEIELIKEKVGEYPILLLDDVLSELDDYRQSHLLHAISGKVQTFVTTTSVDGIAHQTLQEAAMYVVTDGYIKKMR